MKVDEKYKAVKHIDFPIAPRTVKRQHRASTAVLWLLIIMAVVLVTYFGQELIVAGLNK